MVRHAWICDLWTSRVLYSCAVFSRRVCIPLKYVGIFWPRFRAAVIGLYVSYAAPIFLRITSGRDKFVPGTFTLGRWYMPIGIVAVAWVTFIVILLLFPPSQATNAKNMSEYPSCSRKTRVEWTIAYSDYAVVIIMGVFIFATASWIISAHKWFIGPVKTIDEPEYEKESWYGRIFPMLTFFFLSANLCILIFLYLGQFSFHLSISFHVSFSQGLS